MYCYLQCLQMPTFYIGTCTFVHVNGARLASRTSRQEHARLVPQFPNNTIVDWFWGVLWWRGCCCGGERRNGCRHECGCTLSGRRSGSGRGSSDRWRLDVHVIRRFGTKRSDSWSRENKRFPRLMSCDVAQVHDHLRLYVHNLEAVAPKSVSEVQAKTRTSPGVHFPPP